MFSLLNVLDTHAPPEARVTTRAVLHVEGCVHGGEVLGVVLAVVFILAIITPPLVARYAEVTVLAVSVGTTSIAVVFIPIRTPLSTPTTETTRLAVIFTGREHSLLGEGTSVVPTVAVGAVDVGGWVFGFCWRWGLSSLS